MAFSWNPFAKNKNNDTTENNPLNRRNSNYTTFRAVNNDIERIVAAKSVVGKSIENA